MDKSWGSMGHAEDVNFTFKSMGKRLLKGYDLIRLAFKRITLAAGRV